MSAPLERHGTWGWTIVGVIVLVLVYALVVQPFLTGAFRELAMVFAAAAR